MSARAQYLADAERHAEGEQLKVGVGKYDEAEAHRWALRILVNADLAEQENERPLPTSTKPCCGECMVYLGVPAEYKPVPGVERMGFRRVV